MTLTAVPAPVRRSGRPPQRPGQSYLIRTFGCQMNEHD